MRIKNYGESFGGRFRKMREELSISREELGLQIGVSARTIQRMENDQLPPAFEAVCEFCLLYHISTDYLLLGENGMSEEMKNLIVSMAEQIRNERNRS